VLRFCIIIIILIKKKQKKEKRKKKKEKRLRFLRVNLQTFYALFYLLPFLATA
jgi:hypothetical protein